MKELRILSLLSGMLVIAGCLSDRHAAKLTPGETAAHFEQKKLTNGSLDYLVYIPAEAVTAKKRWPAMIFLHGSGERGTNVWDVTKHGPPKIVKDKTDFPFIVISPQCLPGHSWDTEVILALVRDVERRYPIDANRVYLTGLSMGGSGTWNTLMAKPDLFAAAVPICGRGSTNKLASLPPGQLEKIKRLPIWVFHGAKDPTVPVKYSQEMTEALQSLGANVKLTIYPEALHDSWTQTYANQELYDWLLSHDRKSEMHRE